ncbi:MAG TPA: sugar phosphate nucleotidyltransferase [Gammaproteobacteria bacterium]|jgi:glucose-1-phosphate adenylyltransferase|nr:sugar phosphate nucleotidyltransferase [Gammaproteobacteria bacterium]
MSVADVVQQTTAVILAGGKGTRLGVLTRTICKPALPFGAGFRTIDFALSNCVNSGIRRIGVAVQHQRRPLLCHLRDAWQRRVDLEREQFIEAWSAVDRAPFRGYAGTADAVLRNLRTIIDTGSRFVLVLAGDHVYRMDYREMLEHHRREGADATVATIEVPAAEAHHYGVLRTDAAGRVRAFVEKPREVAASPGGSVVASMGIYVFHAEFLARVLRVFRQARRPYRDFGHDLLPALVDEAAVAEFRFRTPAGEPGYWRDVGTPAAYWRTNLDLLSEPPRLRLDDPDWPIGRMLAKPPHRVAAGALYASARPSLVAPGAAVHGAVRGSVLFEDVHVGAGAVVEDAVLLPGARVGAGCHLRGVIVDHDCRVPEGTVAQGLGWEHSREPVILTAADFASPPIRTHGRPDMTAMVRSESAA